MTATQLLNTIGAFGGLIGLVTLLQFIRDRKLTAHRNRLNERTEDQQVEAVTISNLEKKLVYLERLVETLQRQNEKYEERDARRLIRIQELEEKLDRTMSVMREMKREIEDLKEDNDSDHDRTPPVS